MRAAKPGEGYVVFGGRVRLTPVYSDPLAAERALGGSPCWIIAGRHTPKGYETIIVPAVRREQRDGRHNYTWLDENGVDHHEHSYRVDSFETEQAARAALVKRARSSLAHARGQVVAQQRELRKARLTKVVKPGARK